MFLVLDKAFVVSLLTNINLWSSFSFFHMNLARLDRRLWELDYDVTEINGGDVI